MYGRGRDRAARIVMNASFSLLELYNSRTMQTLSVRESSCL